MGQRPRHQDKDLEQLLRDLEANNWRVTKGKKYYKVYCPCGIHQRTVKNTPSDPSYECNVRGWLGRTGCWEQEHR